MQRAEGTEAFGEGEWVIAFSDCTCILKRARRKLLLAALAGGLLLGLYCLHRPLTYTAKSTFKQQQAARGIGEIKNLLASFGSSPEEVSASTLMLSRTVTEEVVKELHLQAMLEQGQAKSLLRRILENMRAEIAYFSYRKSKRAPSAVLSSAQIVPDRLIVADSISPLRCQHVEYAGEVYRSLRVQFASDGRYVVLDESGRQVGSSCLGDSLVTPDFRFTLVAGSLQALKGQTFRLTLLPLRDAAEAVSAMVAIKRDKENKNLLHLSATHSDRHLATAMVNSLMTHYKQYLMHVQQKSSQKQLAYLQHRQSDALDKLRSLMGRQMDLAKTQIEERGFFDPSSEVQYFANLQALQHKRLDELDLMDRILGIDGRVQLPICSRFIEFKELAGVQNEREMLLLKRACLQESPSDLLPPVRSERPSPCQLPTFARLSASRQPLLQPCFQGMTLEAAESLLFEYNKSLEVVQTGVRQIEHVLRQLQQPQFEVSGLSVSAIVDPVCEDLILKSSQLLLLLNDQNNRSAKDQDQLRESLQVIKQYLTSHLKESMEVLALRECVLDEKLQGLRKTMVGLLDKKIALVEESLQERVAATRAAFQKEKEQIQFQAAAMAEKIASLPARWLLQKEFDLQSQMSLKMIEELSRLVEAKNISSNFDCVNSGPMDVAVLPVFPKPPHVMLWSAAGALLGALAYALLVLAQGMARGLPASIDNLALAGQPVAGALCAPAEALSSANVDLFRGLSRLLAGQEASLSVLLALGKGADYSRVLAHFLQKSGKRLLLVDCRWKKGAEPALLHLLQNRSGHILVPQMDGNLAVIDGRSDNGYLAELLSSKAFCDLIEEWKRAYDAILVCTDFLALRMETQVASAPFDRILLTLQDEPYEALTPYFKLNKERPGRAIFLFG